jgi:hypothetical protein
MIPTIFSIVPLFHDLRLSRRLYSSIIVSASERRNLEKVAQMPWEARPGGRYYYRAKKFKGKVIKEYVGAGPSAEAAAAEDALARKTRDTARQLTNERLSALEQQWAIPLEEFKQTSTICDALVAGALLAEDFHQHDRGAWRKRRMTSSKRTAPAPGMIASLFSGPELSPDNVDEVLCILLRRARNGDDGAAEYLAGLSQQASPLWDLLTGLVRTAKASWIALVTLPGEDRALDREGLECQLVLLQRELLPRDAADSNCY